MTEKTTGIGLRHIRIGLRDDTDGTMARPSATHVVGTPYPGIQLSGAATFTINAPEPERVPARGDDQVYYTFHLPPTEGWTGELTCTKQDLPAIALITGTVQWGEAALFEGVAMGSNKEGAEPDLCMWGQRRGVDTDPGSATYGSEIWEAWEIGSCKLTPMPASKEQSAVGEHRYAITMQKVATRITGEPYTEADHGCTKAAVFPIVSKPGKVFYDFDEGDAVTLIYTLTHLPVSATDIYVYVDGVEEPAGWTLVAATGVLTFVAAVDADDPICFMYCTDDILSA